MIKKIYIDTIIQEYKNIDRILQKYDTIISKFSLCCMSDTMRQFEKIMTLIIEKNIYQILQKNCHSCEQKIENYDIIMGKTTFLTRNEFRKRQRAKIKLNKLLGNMGYDNEVIEEVFLKIPHFAKVMKMLSQRYPKAYSNIKSK